MKKAFLTPVVFVLMLLAGSAGHADSEQTDLAFYDLIETYRQSCNDGCQDPFQNKVTFDINQPEKAEISLDIQTRLQQVAVDQAQVWGDTILEGDYHADGQTRLDRVFSLYENEKLIGYQITYSEGAWYIGECDFDGREPSLKGCQPGRIAESSFVSLDFVSFFRDQDDIADFRE